MTEWDAIKADYLATGMAYQDLAAKWNVSISTLKKKAAREGWRDEYIKIALEKEPQKEPKKSRQEPRVELEPELFPELVSPEALAAELRVNRMRKLMETTDTMMDRVINALDIIEPGNTYALSMLVRSLKDLREMQGLNKSKLDLEEQQLRIEIMKQQKQSQIAEPITVEFVNMDGAEK